MTLLIPPDVYLQAAIALLAGLVGAVLGAVRMHRGWAHHDQRAERDFLAGLCLLVVGLSWLVIGLAIIWGLCVSGNSPAEKQVQEVVVFTNAAARISVIFIGLTILYDAWKDWKAAR